jgi:ubiquinone/menaquinone biosynthesis C-methylase UbiE
MNERVYNQKAEKLRSAERKERLEVDKVIGLITGKNDFTSLLDIGTGSGLFAEAFAGKNLNVTGVDINPEMIEAAKAYLPESEFKQAPAEKLPFPDKSFDAAFLGMVLHEADDHLKALKEARRVTRSAVWVLEWYYKPEDFGPPLEHRLSPDFINSLAKEAGYKEVISFEMSNLVLYKLAV